ncbi:MAG: hypothetical protein JNG84_05275 [Archangium sp.]|nr:hypothetical protein [Archangium sp.]
MRSSMLVLAGLVAVAVSSCRGPRLSGIECQATGPESCDGVDNDCNGVIDDGLAEVRCGVGACARSAPACIEGEPIFCEAGLPEVEVCDGLDNDCDGQLDNGACAPPVVMCPGSVSARAGVEVTLNGHAQASEGSVVSTAWTVKTRPSGSTADVMETGTSARFTPDVGGVFELQFCATDSAAHSACCTTRLTTSACSMPPTPPVSTACTTSWDGRPIVQFDPVPAGLQYELSVSGDSTVVATAQSGWNHLRPAVRLNAGGAPPGAAVALEVRACRSDDTACCSAPAPLTVNVVSECSTTTTPTAATVVLSEYVVNGEGQCPSTDCATHDTCQAGEAIELTNLSNCPISLDGHHFAYRNSSASMNSLRWMNFGPSDIIPPRGVYVAIRGRQYAPTCSRDLGAQRAGLYGLAISSLAMQGSSLCSGWFNNVGGGMSELRLAPGTVPTGMTPDFTPSTAIARIAPYLPSSGSIVACRSIGFDAVDSCGTVTGGSTPTTVLNPNQLGRLWHPCDAVTSPVPACTRN